MADEANDLDELFGNWFKKELSGAFSNSASQKKPDDADKPNGDSEFSFKSIMEFLPKIFAFFGIDIDANAITDQAKLQTKAADPKTAIPTRVNAPASPDGNSVVLMGHSVSVGEAEAKVLKEHFSNVVNMAQKGSHLEYIDDAQIAKVPQGAAVIINMGVNDIDKTHPISAADAEKYARGLVGRAREIQDQRGANVTINSVDVNSPNPVWAANIKAVNDAVQAQADKNGIKITNVSQVSDWADQLHKTTIGNNNLAKLDLQTFGISA